MSVSFESYLCAAEPNASGEFPVSCMDERKVKPTDPILGGKLYHQIIGGRYVLGLNMAIAMEMNKPGRFVSMGVPVHGLANLADNALTGRYQTNFHEACAAYEGADAVTESTIASATHPNTTNSSAHGLVFDRAQLIDPSLTDKTYYRVVEATERVRNSGLLVPTHASDAAIGQKVQLVDAPHSGDRFLVTNNPNVMFASADAYDEGNPAYFNNMGVLEAMRWELVDTIPVGAESLRAATAVYIGEAATNFLKGIDGSILPIQRIADL